MLSGCPDVPEHGRRVYQRNQLQQQGAQTARGFAGNPEAELPVIRRTIATRAQRLGSVILVFENGRGWPFTHLQIEAVLPRGDLIACNGRQDHSMICEKTTKNNPSIP